MTNRVADTGFDLFELLKLFRANLRTIVLITGASLGAGVAYAMLATEIYRAQVVLVPADSQPNVAGGLGALPGLASLAGLSVGSGSSYEALAVLRSNAFARSFIQDNGLTDVITASRFSFDTQAPDIRDAIRIFDLDIRSVSEDKKNGIVTLSIDWKDPRKAAEWANELVLRVNAQLRAQALAKHERNMRYLQTQLEAARVVSVQQAIGRVLESEMQKQVLAKGSQEYAFKIVDRAMPPNRRQSPQRSVVVALAGILGLIAATAFVWLRELYRSSQRELPVARITPTV